MSDTTFADRYGPWALVAGASEGVGAAYARAMADRGLNVVLLARRQSVLNEVAGAIHADTGVEARAVAIDLATHDAASKVTDATTGLDIGMLMYCAGSDPNYERFLSNPVEVALGLVQRNCVVAMRLCHHFAAPMATRGKGGIVLVSSGAGLAGGANMVAYCASKAFDMVMAEALWAELHDEGVDVLGLVLSVTDTPAERRILARRGLLLSADDTSPIPGATSVEDTVAEAIDNLSNGPTWFVSEPFREAEAMMRSMSRNEVVKTMLQMAAEFMGENGDDACLGETDRGED
jgi:short-subunit dehydrogenase